MHKGGAFMGTGARGPPQGSCVTIGEGPAPRSQWAGLKISTLSSFYAMQEVPYGNARAPRRLLATRARASISTKILSINHL